MASPRYLSELRTAPNPEQRSIRADCLSTVHYMVVGETRIPGPTSSCVGIHLHTL